MILDEHELAKLSGAIEALQADNARLHEALEKILKYCEGGEPCGASEHAPCHLYEHRVAAEALRAK